MILTPSLAELLLFQPSRRDPGSPPALKGIPGACVALRTGDGVRIEAWWYETVQADDGDGPVVLFLHGNAGTVADRIPIAEGLVGEGLPVLLLEYRGYGRSQGRPSEEGLHEDALAGWGFLLELGWASRRQVVFGRSMGAAVAARLVAECPSGGLILESAFTSLRDMARLLYPFLPGFFSSRLEGRFDTRRQTESVRAPLLVIHGEEDDLVPVTMGRSVYEAGKGPKVWMPVPGAGHNDVYWVGGEEYFRRIRDFALTSVSGGNGAGGAPV